jgi:hypothetical protein
MSQPPIFTDYLTPVASDRESRVRSIWHPGSTSGDLAKGLNLNPGGVSTRLTQLTKAGEIKRASHGYRTNQAPLPRTHQRPLRRSH